MKYFFGFLAIIAAIVVVVLLTLNLFRNLDDSTVTPTTSSTYDLKSDEAKESVARYTVSGAIGAPENYSEIRITISKNARTIDIVNGYSGAVAKTSTLPNTPESYNAFLGALSAARFSDRKDTELEPRDTCVTGNRMYYLLQVGSERKVDTWSTTCGIQQGDFSGLSDAVSTLFRNQIPSYTEFTAGVNLGLR